MVTVLTMWWLIRPIYYKCLVCCFLRRRTSSSAALMAGLGSHWARQISLARLLRSQMRNIRVKNDKKHVLYALDKHHTSRDDPKRLSPLLVPVRRWSRNRRRDSCNHSKNMLLAACGFENRHPLGSTKRFLPNTHLRSRRLRRIKRYRF